MITEQVGNRIRALRKQRGLSQEKLALVLIGHTWQVSKPEGATLHC